MTCGNGLIWNNPKQWCDFPENVPTIATKPPVVLPVTTKTPIVTTKTPVVTTKTPVVTTKSPVVTTKSPVVTTKSPVVTTKTPVVTTKTAVVTTKTPVVTTRKPVAPPVVTAPTVNQPFQCPTANGLFADPASCFKYYNCGNGFAYSMNCNDGLKWNSSGQYCDFPQNVQC